MTSVLIFENNFPNFHKLFSTALFIGKAQGRTLLSNGIDFTSKNLCRMIHPIVVVLIIVLIFGKFLTYQLNKITREGHHI